MSNQVIWYQYCLKIITDFANLMEDLEGSLIKAKIFVLIFVLPSYHVYVALCNETNVHLQETITLEIMTEHSQKR